jgi:hypothetical protein
MKFQKTSIKSMIIGAVNGFLIGAFLAFLFNRVLNVQMEFSIIVFVEELIFCLIVFVMTFQVYVYKKGKNPKLKPGFARIAIVSAKVAILTGIMICTIELGSFLGLFEIWASQKFLQIITPGIINCGGAIILFGVGLLGEYFCSIKKDDDTKSALKTAGASA